MKNAPEDGQSQPRRVLVRCDCGCGGLKHVGLILRPCNCHKTIWAINGPNIGAWQKWYEITRLKLYLPVLRHNTNPERAYCHDTQPTVSTNLLPNGLPLLIQGQQTWLSRFFMYDDPKKVRSWETRLMNSSMQGASLTTHRNIVMIRPQRRPEPQFEASYQTIIQNWGDS